MSLVSVSSLALHGLAEYLIADVLTLEENEMLSRTKCRVWAYDFSVVDFGQQLEPANRDRATFLQAGIAGKTDTTKSPPFYSISDLMDMNGHEYM